MMNPLFLERMKELLKDEYDAFVTSLDQPCYRGLRINTLKINKDQLIADAYSLKPSPFYRHSYLITDDRLRPGRSFWHRQGAIYLQEPSASGVVSQLDIQQDDWVLDLCAAPGSKSSQIAAELNSGGFFIANEIDRKRAEILLSNFERLGVSNAVITNAHPKQLCQVLNGCMDKVLVDAPCSGEGMLKKEDKAMEDWSMAHVTACSERQKNILDSAYEALRQGGVLVYSSCTYAMEENEQVVDAFLKTHPDIELIPITCDYGREGYDWGLCEGSKVRRIFPMDGGEGQFMAKFNKLSGNTKRNLPKLSAGKLSPCVKLFLEQQLSLPVLNCMEQRGKVYATESFFPDLKGISILRSGVLLGEIIKGRFEPHQHFYTAASYYPYFKNRTALTDEEALLFVQGHPLTKSAAKGYVLLEYQELPLGFGKSDGTVIKNKYPKGLRSPATGGKI